MQKWLIFLVPFVLIAATNDNRGNSLYGNSPQNQTNTSHLTQDEQNFANQLSPIHRNVFMNQFTPQQRTNAMALTKAKDPLNTEPGPVTPDHSVEIIMQGARAPQNGQQNNQNNTQQNGSQNNQQNGSQNNWQQNGSQNNQQNGSQNNQQNGSQNNQQNGSQNNWQQNGSQNNQQNGSQNNQQNGSQNNSQSQMPQQYQPQQQQPYDQRQLPDGCKRY